MDTTKWRKARSDVKGAFVGVDASRPGQMDYVLTGMGGYLPVAAGAGVLPFDSTELEYGSGYEQRWDPNVIDPEFKKAYNELKKGGKIRILESSIETIWNMVPGSMADYHMLGTLNAQQWKEVIKDFDPLGEMHQRYEGDPYGFYGDIIGSVVGFTGGVGALSKAGAFGKTAGKVGRKTGRGITYAVQVEEEIITLLGAKLFPKFTQKIGGTFDWEEALVLGARNQLDKIRAFRQGVTKRKYQKQRQINEWKKAYEKEKDTQRKSVMENRINRMVLELEAEEEEQVEGELLSEFEMESLKAEIEFRKVDLEMDSEVETDFKVKLNPLKQSSKQS